MSEYIIVGCDLHDKTMLLKIARGRSAVDKVTWANNACGRRAMLKDLKRRSAEADGAAVVFAYEASGLGFRLHDFLTEGGIACYVLAPTKMPKSLKHRRSKCDEKDAEQILELLRAHILAGNKLPSVWIPDAETREDREVVRARLDAKSKSTKVKIQIQTLLKRNGIDRRKDTGKGWTISFRKWLFGLTTRSRKFSHGTRLGLGTLLRQLEFLESEATLLDAAVAKVSKKERYAATVERMTRSAGVGILTAMVFLTEMGDLSRFSNRKQIGAYIGLVPSSDDTAESDRKGHITHQGPWRVRWILCQAVWSLLRTNPEEADCYARIVRKNPKHKKIAVVACMRRLAVSLWHIGRRSQREGGVFDGVLSTAAC